MKDYSNYHNTNIKERIKYDGDILLDYTLEYSSESFNVVIDGLEHKVVIQSTSNDPTGEKRNIICRPNIIDRGTIVQDATVNWLVMTLPLTNDVYSKATIQLCNTSITIKGERVPIDWDQWGNPIEWSDGEDKSFICIADKSLVYGSADMNNAINLPDNKIKVIIPYTDLKFDRFTLYNEPYIVRDIDLTQSINGKGLISITGERIVEKA